MDNRRIGAASAAFGGLVGAAGLRSVAAQEDAEVTINGGSDDDGGEDEATVTTGGGDLSGLGDEIRAAAGDDDGGDDDGGDDAAAAPADVSATTTLTLDESEGLAVADASGGDNNFAFVS